MRIFVFQGKKGCLFIVFIIIIVIIFLRTNDFLPSLWRFVLQKLILGFKLILSPVFQTNMTLNIWNFKIMQRRCHNSALGGHNLNIAFCWILKRSEWSILLQLYKLWHFIYIYIYIYITTL